MKTWRAVRLAAVAALLSGWVLFVVCSFRFRDIDHDSSCHLRTLDFGWDCTMAARRHATTNELLLRCEPDPESVARYAGGSELGDRNRFGIPGLTYAVDPDACSLRIAIDEEWDAAGGAEGATQSGHTALARREFMDSHLLVEEDWIKSLPAHGRFVRSRSYRDDRGDIMAVVSTRKVPKKRSGLIPWLGGGPSLRYEGPHYHELFVRMGYSWEQRGGPLRLPVPSPCPRLSVIWCPGGAHVIYVGASNKWIIVVPTMVLNAAG